MARRQRDAALWAMTVTAVQAVSATHVQADGPSTTSISTTVTQQAVGGSSVSVSSVTVGGAGRSADVRVINGRVWIDGEAVPEDATHWRTRSGLVFRIRREGGQVHLSTE